MLTIRALSDGKGYAARHLQHSDYYAEGERIAGHWYGRGAELLGMSGTVDTGTSMRYAKGSTPGRKSSSDSVAALTAWGRREKR